MVSWLSESGYSRLRLLFRIDEAELKTEFGTNENKMCSRLKNTKVIDLLWETKIGLTEEDGDTVFTSQQQQDGDLIDCWFVINIC